MPVILFVCTANRFRSVIAAGYTEHLLRERDLVEGWRVASAGVWTSNGLPAHPEAIREANRLGLNLGAHKTSEINQAAVDMADLIIVMERGQREALEWEFVRCRGKVVMLAELAGEGEKDIVDPVKDGFGSSDVVVERIIQCVEKGLPEMLQQAMQNNRLVHDPSHPHAAL